MIIGSYAWRGGREAWLRFGPSDGPVVLALLPLLEEANRTRAFAVDVLRRLAASGVGSVLPELPGTGESLVPTRELRLADLRAAVADLAAQCGAPVIGFAIRSGCLLDTEAALAGRWQLAPQDGTELRKEWARIRQLPLDLHTENEVAGNHVAPALLAELEAPTATAAAPRRVARLESDPRPADVRVPGTPLWRRTEPDAYPALAERVAEDLLAWVRQCVG